MATPPKVPTKSAVDLPKSRLFAELGYGGDPALLELLLEQAGLSHPRKTNIAETKRDAVRALIRQNFRLVCNRGDCQQAARVREDPRRTVPAATPAACEICGGSVNERHLKEMVAACLQRGWRRICVVGGSPGTRAELERLRERPETRPLELRLVRGDRARTERQARADLARSDLVVIWASTELDHKVSMHYAGTKVITVAQRGVAELAKEVIAAAQRG